MNRNSFAFRALLTAVALLVGLALTYTLGFLLARPFFGRPLTEALSQPGGIRLLQFLQSVFVFVLPALCLPRFFGEKPGRFLCIGRPSWGQCGMAVLALVACLPLVNVLYAFNQGLHLPACLAGVEDWMRRQEDAAALVTNLLMADTTLPGLLLNALVVAVMAGLGEELFFRGFLLRFLSDTFGSGRRARVAAIWLTAFLFSAMHLQFYGFLPRFLLGALFGYLLLWTGSLWVPILAHAVNNLTALLAAFAEAKAWVPEGWGEQTGMAGTWWVSAIGLVVLTGCALWFAARKTSFRRA